MSQSHDVTKATEQRAQSGQPISEWIARYSGLFDVMPHQVWIADPVSMRGVYFNRRWFEYTGMSRTQALENLGLPSVHPEDLDLLVTTMQRSRAVLHSFDVPIRIRGRNGVYRWFNVGGAPSFDENDEVVAWVGTNLDIDERLRNKLALRDAYERSSKLQTVTARLASAATGADIARVLEADIVPWLEVSGGDILTFDGAAGAFRQIGQLAHDGPAPGTPSPTLTAFRENRVVALGSRTEILTHFPDLRERLDRTGAQATVDLPLAIDAAPFGVLHFDLAHPTGFPAERLEFMAILANLVAQSLDRARLFEATQSQAEILEQRVAERTHELALRNEELEAFVYTASHDLRTPLHKLSMSGGLLVGAVQSGNVEDARWLADSIEGGVRRMDQLIRDLLNLSRAGRVPEEPRRVELGATVAQVVAELAERLESRAVTVEQPPRWPALRYAETELYQLVLNLVGNASRFARRTVRVGWRTTRTEFEFEVEDDGPGIPTGEREHVFKLFAKLDPSSGSTGVGLAIVKRISERHGGRVWIADSELGGARFVVAMPIACLVEP